MDVAWIILDSLSFEATPFATNGPDTMPQLERLAFDHGVVFTNAYSPGPTSPSSHGSFFTGELPSQTGMTEASPYYSSDYETIIERLSESHETFMTSANPFIFNGLDRGLDEKDDLVWDRYVVFDEATNPRNIERKDEESDLEYYSRIVFENGKPIRSLINGLNAFYQDRTQDTPLPETANQDQEMYQYASTMNNRIRKFRNSTAADTFVIGNYMDIHAPLDASEDAISKFSSKSREELPVGVRGQDVHRQVMEGDTQVGEDMFDLYKATIFDTDRKIAGLIEELIHDDVFVIVTADHGNWFRREAELEDRRIHVPLIIFSPTENEPRVVEETVNLRSMPRTTIEAVHGDTGDFSGANMLSIEEDQLSITEFIHDSTADGSPVTPTGSMDARYDFTLIKGDTRVDHIDGEIIHKEGDDDIAVELIEVAEELLAQGFKRSNQKDMSEGVQQQLRDLGYID